MITNVTDEQIAQMSKTIFRFCQSRTGSYHDAEDLAQEILLVACKTTNEFPNEKAFYAFVWKTADLVLKSWYREQAKRKSEELDENLADERYALLEEKAADKEQLRLIVRELARLSSNYRRVTVEYYIDGKSVGEIAKHLSLTESMVKYLLFQSRKHIKEGIVMEKEYGRLSYDPVELTLFFWGGRNVYYEVFDGNKLRQNIVMACYYDKLTEEQLSLQLGVPTAYLEDELRKLEEYALVKKKGIAYQSNIVILTKKELSAIKKFNEKDLKEIADGIKAFTDENLADLRAMNFYGSDMPDNSLKWMLVSMILRLSYVDMLQGDIELEYPKDCFGNECFRFLTEREKNNPYFVGISGCQTKNGFLFFWDVPVNGEMVHPKVGPVQGDMLSSLLDHQPETNNEKLLCSELLEQGLAKKENDMILPNFPCLNADQTAKFNEGIQAISQSICENAKSRIDGIAKVMMEYAPEHLADYARRLPALYSLGEAEVIMQNLCESGWLLPCRDGMSATTILMKNK